MNSKSAVTPAGHPEALQSVDNLDATVAENPAVLRALRRLQESQSKGNHMSHWTKHSSHSVKHHSSW